MSSVANVAVHSSEYPEAVSRDLLQCLRDRQINPRFHYESYKQSQKWLALHQAYAPSRIDPDCIAAYDGCFRAAAGVVGSSAAHVVGLGCGGGQKDARLLQLLKSRSVLLDYTPCDVSLALVLTARSEALRIVGESQCHPLVCDLVGASGLPEVVGPWTSPGARRVLTFFGMIPNFEPSQILPRLADFVHPEDLLLFSANLAPGTDYEAGIRKVMSGYDNDLTRDWLMTFLLDLGMELTDGRCVFALEQGEENLKRIVAIWRFDRERRILVQGEEFVFRAGEEIRLFYSYRYTPDRLEVVLRKHGLVAKERWITRSEEEGVFLCSRAGE